MGFVDEYLRLVNESSRQELERAAGELGLTVEELRRRGHESLAQHRVQLEDSQRSQKAMIDAWRELERDPRTRRMVPRVIEFELRRASDALVVKTAEHRARELRDWLRVYPRKLAARGHALARLARNEKLDDPHADEGLTDAEIEDTLLRQRAKAAKAELRELAVTLAAAQRRGIDRIAALAILYRSCFPGRRSPSYKLLAAALGGWFEHLSLPRTPVKVLVAKVEQAIKRPDGRKLYPTSASAHDSLSRANCASQPGCSF
ncbi:MAG: hypothetical protein WCA59_20165 [Candidatus Binataceae bacterium]